MRNIKTFFLIKPKVQFLICGIVVVIAFLLHWLITAESSPFYNYFIWHVGYGNTWLKINLLPIFAGALASHSANPDSINAIGVIIALAIQWLVVGFLLSIPIAQYLRGKKPRE